MFVSWFYCLYWLFVSLVSWFLYPYVCFLLEFLVLIVCLAVVAPQYFGLNAHVLESVACVIY